MVPGNQYIGAYVCPVVEKYAWMYPHVEKWT